MAPAAIMARFRDSCFAHIIADGVSPLKIGG
jgi:hypothetical protein